MERGKLNIARITKQDRTRWPRNLRQSSRLWNPQEGLLATAWKDGRWHAAGVEPSAGGGEPRALWGEKGDRAVSLAGTPSTAPRSRPCSWSH